MLNWLVLGIGDITTRRVIPAIQAEPRSKLRGIVTRDPAKASPYGARVWTSLEAALEDSSIDAVYVATPVSLHAPAAITALRAARHVLAEKPMALNFRQAEEMVQAARECGRTLGVSYYRRCYPKVRRAKELIATGGIGRPVFAEIACHDWFDAEDGRRAWLLDPAMAGGGPLYDIASHRIDLLNFFFGEPSRASGQLSHIVHDRPVEDCATVLIEYTSGVRGVVDVRWHSRVARDPFRIYGTEGEMDLSPLNGPELRRGGTVELLPAHANLHYPCIENFVSAVLDGAPLLSSGESAVWTDWVTEQVMESARAGCFRYHGS